MPVISGKKMRKALEASERNFPQSTSIRSRNSLGLRRSRTRRQADQQDLQKRDFGYQTITVERPVRDDEGNVVLGQQGKAKGKPQADSNLRDTENVPLSEEIGDFFAREVLPHVPDAWIDDAKTKTGYEIPFNRHFYVFTPPRPLEEIDAELKKVTDKILGMIGGFRHELSSL